MIDAFLVVDKPAGITSHDVVAVVRAVTGTKKVGHSGTLDPFATGVLALALGATTRLLQFLDESIKVYDATIRLGTATDTGDPTGEVIRSAAIPPLEAGAVQGVLDGFLGERMQRPPAFSAVKHKGKPLYWYARRGEHVEVAARPITVSEARLVELSPDHLRVQLTCSRGTYARVLADEIASALGTAGHLEALARLRSGPFRMTDAVSMDALGELVSAEPGHTWQDVLLPRRREERLPWRPRDEVIAALAPRLVRPLDALGHLPLIDVDEAGVRRVRNGHAPGELPPGVEVGGRYLLVHGADLIAVAEQTARGPKVLRVVGQDDPPRRPRRP
ncbi:MAG: tRNA pseudouridine(55) synthase TruB [Alphaproteobacteria bacterium]|nr:tRNA pseudouridine(55) synthase TruB [Alphaproteobacteria bacterium]